MTFAPIHDFIPRKFPRTLDTIPSDGGASAPDWKNLPAFMVDRQSNQNSWLTDIFGKTNNEIPKGENSDGIPLITPLSAQPVAPLQGATISTSTINIPR